MLTFSNTRRINYPMLLRVLGWLLMIEGSFMSIPLLTCIIYGESDVWAFAAAFAVTIICGALMTFCIRPASPSMAKREGFLLTASVWVVFSFFGMIPFMLCDTPIGVTDAFYETMSGFTTTGSTVYPTVETLSHGINLWRCLTQWLGGMGIILFTLAVLPMLNYSGGMQMFNAEVTGITHDKIRPRISQTAKSLWAIYIALTVVLILLLWAGPMTLFESICHAFGAISTGGYTTHDSGIGAWNESVYIKVVLIVFMFLGGVNFGLIFKAAHGDFKALRTNDVLHAYIGVILVMLLLFGITIVYRGQMYSWVDVTIDPLFQIVSTITSTGFTVTNFEAWGPLVLALTFVLMFSGACAGSTSGGAKIDRVLYLVKNARNELYRCIHPNAILSVKVSDKVISPEIVTKVIAFLCIYMMLMVAGGTVLAAMGVPIIDAFFSAFSCTSNTGLGAGVTGFGGGYDILPDTAKWVLSLLMIIGRLEIFTVLVLFTPSFWHR